jgi:DNA-binding NtrC family response regulator
LEFVFRTLVNLRMDVDDLRRDFERYRRIRDPDGGGSMVEISDFPLDLPLTEVFPEGKEGEGPSMEPTSGERGEIPGHEGREGPGIQGEEEVREPEEGTVVYRPGMTMEEVERKAIGAVLQEVGGNRRKAAERLGIGERTLYRKIKKYGFDED